MAGLVWLLSSLLLAAPQAGIAAPPPPAEASAGSAPDVPRPIVGMTLYDAAGHTPAMVMSRLGDRTIYPYTSNTLCELHDSTSLPIDPAFGWRVMAKTLAGTPSELKIHVEWHRMWQDGHSVTGPSDARDLTLHPGDRVSLDSMAEPAEPAQCAGTRLVLQVGIDTGATMRGRGVFVGRESGGGSDGMTGDGREIPPLPEPPFAGAGAAGKAPAEIVASRDAHVRAEAGQAPMPTWTASPSADGMTLSSGVGALSARSRFDPATLEAVDVDLWFVHQLPDASESSQHLRLQTRPPRGAFTFDRLAIATSAGPLTIYVTGVVRAQRTADGAENLEVLSLWWFTRTAGSGKSWFLTASGSKVLPMPKPGDVVALDMPSGPPGESLSQALEGHRLSLRVRVNGRATDN